MSGSNEPQEAAQIDEILLDDVHETVVPDRRPCRKKRWYIPCLPRLYWFFYRKPLYLLVLIPPLMSSWVGTYSNLTMAKIIDCLKEPDAVDQVKRFGLLNLLVACTSAVLQFIDTFGWQIVGDLVKIKTRCIVFKSILRKDVEFFDQRPIGELITFLSDDVDRVANSFSWSKAFQFRTIGSLITNIGVSFLIDWRLSIFAMISTAIVSYVSNSVKEPARKRMRESRQVDANSITIADEVISNIRIVQAFNRQAQEVERYQREVDESALRSTTGSFLMNLGGSLTSLLDWGTVAICLNLGSYLVAKQEVTAGNLFVLTRTAFQIGFGMNQILMSLSQEQRAMESADKLFELMDEVSAVEFDGGRTIPDFKGDIELQNVWFKYPTRNAWVMRDVSMRINAGEIVALVGHSGSGKSTLVQLLLRFYDVNQGRILIDGVDIKQLDPRWLHKVIGVVQQEPILFAMPIRDNVCYGLEEEQIPTDEAIWGMLETAHAKGFVSKLPDGLDTMVGEKGATLSGGQKQRIAIARATITDPVVLITDEATSALDAQSEKKVQIALDQVMKGRTSIIIAHRLGTITGASKIFVFESGELVEEGSREELLARRGHFYALVERQLQSAPPSES